MPPGWRDEFHSGFKQRLEQSFAPQLPMRIDSSTVWTSIRMNKNAIFISAHTTDDRGADDINYQYVKAYSCSTPVNVLMMLLGYDLRMSYYLADGSYATQFEFNASKCGL